MKACPVLDKPGICFRQPGEVPPAGSIWPGLAQAIARRRLGDLREIGGDEFARRSPDASRSAATQVRGMRVCRHRHARAADGQDRAGRAPRCSKPRSIPIRRYVHRRRHCPRACCRKRASGTRAIRTTTCASMRARTARLRDLRRRGPQDGPGRRHRSSASPRLAASCGEILPSRDARPPLVGPGHRDQRRLAVHRRNGRAAVRGHRLLRQRHDVRHAGRA